MTIWKEACTLVYILPWICQYVYIYICMICFYYHIRIILTKLFLDDTVARNRNTLPVNLSKTTFVNQFSNRLQIWISPSYVRFHNAKHIYGSLIQFYEYTIVDLFQTEELKYLTYFWRNLINTKIYLVK